MSVIRAVGVPNKKHSAQQSAHLAHSVFSSGTLGNALEGSEWFCPKGSRDMRENECGSSKMAKWVTLYP